MISKILSGVYESYNQALPGQPLAPSMENGELKTFCNFSINHVCNEVNYTKFNAGINLPVSANTMVKTMSDPTGDWMTVAGDVAQYHANQGALVIAGQSNPQGHGHVCVVIPGELKDSGHFVKKVPVVMNVGKDVFIGKPVSFAFQLEPTYFVLKATIPS